MASKPRKQSQPVLQGPPRERYQHGPLHTIQAPEANAGVFCKRDPAPTVLDWMRDKGMLGKTSEEADRRYSAGMWLRECYWKTDQQRLVADYSQRGGRSTGDMSEAAAWNLKAFQQAMRDMGICAMMVRSVCVEDRVLRGDEDRRIFVDGLDLLANARGI